MHFAMHLNRDLNKTCIFLLPPALELSIKYLPTLSKTNHTSYSIYNQMIYYTYFMISKVKNDSDTSSISFHRCP